MADSIRRFGFAAPIVCRRENLEVIAGHTRLKAAKLLGLTRVPVRLLDISERDAHLLALADNRLGEIAEWDERAVGEQLSDVSFSDALLAGWSGDELGKLADSIIGASESADSSPQLSNGLKYQLLVECENEEQQAALLTQFEADGLRCKPVIA